MRRHRGDPLVAADHEVHPHQVVVDRVREVVGRQPRALVGALEDHHVVAVGLGLDGAADGVGEAHALTGVVGRAEADHPRLARVELRLHVGRVGVAPDRPRAVVARRKLRRLLSRSDGRQFVLRREVDVRAAFAQKVPYVGEVDLLALGLPVRPVLAAAHRVLVGLQPEVREAAFELLQRALDLARLVGVFDAYQVAPLGTTRDVLVDRRDVDAADVHEAGRRRAEPGHLRAVGQLPGRIALFPVLRLGQIRGEQGVDDRTVQHRRSGLPGRSGVFASASSIADRRLPRSVRSPGRRCGCRHGCQPTVSDIS